MKTFLFIFLAGYAVRCDDNYYVVRIPEALRSKDFKVYWNVPTMQCKSKGIPFDDLFEEYGIIQNTDDKYRGDKIAILYDPGNFPALIKNASTGELKYRNGGVPQEGDLMDHLQNFKKEMDLSIPDANFNGIGIIDFESWRPILRQNFGSLTPYKDVSYDIEKKRHWWWKKQWIQEEAKRRFEASGRDFMQTTIALAKKMRPKALWGYYGFPECFNRPQNGHPEECANDVPGENNVISWLWKESTALYPSVYSQECVTSDRLAAFIKGRIKESERVREKDTPILPYWWYRYRDGGYFREEDLTTSFNTFYNSKASGFIIWGSSKDVNTKTKCINLRKYVTETLGPAVAKYTKNTRTMNDVSDDGANILFKPEDVTEFDPEYNWVPPENYTSNIEHIVEEDLKTRPEDTKASGDGNILIDMILNRIANFCLYNCDKNNEVTSKTPTALTTKNPFQEASVNTTGSTSVEEETTIGHETFFNNYSTITSSNTPTDDSEVIAVTNTNKETGSNELSTTTIYDNDLNTSDLHITSNSNEENIKSLGDVEKTTESILSSEISSTKNLMNYNSNFDQTGDYDEANTDHSIKEINLNGTNFSLPISTTTPKLNLSTSLVNSSSDVTSEPNFGSNSNNMDNLSSDNINNLSDTSPSNLHLTTTSRPIPINWRNFYFDLMNLSSYMRNEFETSSHTNDVVTTAAPEFVDQVLVSASASSSAVALNMCLMYFVYISSIVK